jgi:hypothetical protein
MKNQLKLFFLFFITIAYAQEEKKIINGKILFDASVVSDVHIVNINTNQGTITNDNGWFEISVYIGDSLEFTHINLEEKLLIVTKKMMLKNNIEIELQEKTYTLDEMTLGTTRSILYIGKGLMPPPIVNATTLKLPYANTTAKKDNSIVNIRSGGVINLDNLINSLNSKNRLKKQLQKIKQEDNLLSKIRKHFTDDFFITDLKIKKENINPFLNYCFRKNITNHYNRKENIKLTMILIAESKTFPQKIKSDSILLSRK